MSYKASDGSIWEGAVPDEKHEYLQCEVCGSKSIKMVSHFDGRDFYGYGYNCENGHYIMQKIARRRWNNG